jgi:hypothetical protein
MISSPFLQRKFFKGHYVSGPLTYQALDEALRKDGEPAGLVPALMEISESSAEGTQNK